MPKIISIIPVKGREPLVYHTVRRLVNNGIDVIACGHTFSEKIVCEMAGANFIQVRDSIPLGKKWQLCLTESRKMKPDAILYMGSSDWVSNNWCEVLYKDLEDGYAMTGTKGIYFLDIQPRNQKRMIWWGGYEKSRGDEPIGTGRLFSAKILDLMEWRLFDITKNSSIDHCHMLALKAMEEMWAKGKLVHFNKSHDIASLSISTYRWPNKHNFDGESKYPTAHPVKDVEKLLSLHFKEALNLFNE